MKGVPDDNNSLPYGFLRISSDLEYEYLSGGPKDQLRFSHLQNIGQGCSDAQPDIFNFNGYSGKFNFDWDGNIVVASESEISITAIQNNGPLSRINGWNIKTPDGLLYKFTSVETTSNLKSGKDLCYLAQGGFNSSWYLTEISDPFNKRKLFFEYDQYTINDHNILRTQTKMHLIASNEGCGGSIKGDIQYNSTSIDIRGRFLRRIYSNTSPVEVLFQPGAKKVMNTSDDLFALSEIQIRNRYQDTLIKKYDLKHNYSTSRLTLTSVQELGRGSSILPPYQFFYHDGVLPKETKQKDHWGYKNNNTSQELFPPYFFMYGQQTFGFGTADRSPDFEGSRTGILYKVIHPTGGYDQYTFEQNTYGKVSDLQIDEWETKPIVTGAWAKGIL